MSASTEELEGTASACKPFVTSSARIQHTVEMKALGQTLSVASVLTAFCCWDEHHDQNDLGGEVFISASISRSQFITEGARVGTQAGT